MIESSKLVVVIAAGGTAGHVRPALAVGEALRARGATVTFAGSPDRVESRLVPEAGFELDTFEISGFPRKPSLALLRSLWRAGEGTVRLPRDPAQRRPDVVLGGGGYVAGPMVLAARLSRIPAALTEADAHLGLANRLAAPFASKLFLAYEIDRAGLVPRSRSSAARSPTAHLGASRVEARARFGIEPERAGRAVFGALAGATSLNEMAVAAWGDAGPPSCTSPESADFASLASRVHRRDYLLMPQTDHFGDVLAAADVAVSRAGEQSGSSLQPGRRRSSFRTRTRPPTTRR